MTTENGTRLRPNRPLKPLTQPPFLWPIPPLFQMAEMAQKTKAAP